MKKNLYIFIAFCLLSSNLLAQDDRRNIVEDLNTTKFGEGNVKVLQDETIQNMVAVYRTTAGRLDENSYSSTNFTKVNGFKIQVFSGNNQQKSRREAEWKKNQVQSTFPELETVITYNAPSWRVRTGNFLTREEAEEFLLEMKKTFPSFGKEMYIVKDIVKRPAE